LHGKLDLATSSWTCSFNELFNNNLWWRFIV